MDRIVVGADPSPAGARALEWALREAVSRRLPLLAVRAWSLPAVVGEPFVTALPDLADQAEAQAEQVAADLLKAACATVPGADGVETRAAAAQGRPAQVLVALGKGASLLVVGTRGAGALSRAVLGSVSAAVLHHAECPVAVVPDSGPASGTSRVVVGVDHSPPSLAALRVAVDHARRTGATLVPVLVHDPVFADLLVDPVDGDAAVRRALLAAAAHAGAEGLDVEPVVRTGQASAVLTGLAGPSDLLVVGSRGRGGFAGLLLGSTSSQSAAHAAGPVLVVRR